MSRKGKRRLNIEIPEELYKNLEEDSKYRNWTITMYVIQALLDMINKSKAYKS